MRISNPPVRLLGWAVSGMRISGNIVEDNVSAIPDGFPNTLVPGIVPHSDPFSSHTQWQDLHLARISS